MREIEIARTPLQLRLGNKLPSLRILSPNGERFREDLSLGGVASLGAWAYGQFSDSIFLVASVTAFTWSTLSLVSAVIASGGLIQFMT